MLSIIPRFTSSSVILIASAGFIAAAGEGPVNLLLAQRDAAARGTFSEDIRRKRERAARFAWDFGRIYDKGLLRGKRGMLCVTTGGPEALYQPAAAHGATLDQNLWPVTHGTLHFCGLEVLPTFKMARRKERCGSTNEARG